MSQDKKKMLTVIVGKLNGKSESKPRSEDGAAEKEVSESNYDMAAEEVMSAFKAEDVPMLGRALKAFVELCMYADEDESEDEEESSESEESPFY